MRLALRELPSNQLLRGRTVLEIATTTAGGYAGRMLVQLGASVLRVDSRLDVDAPADVMPSALHWLNAEKETVPDDRLSEALERSDLVILERDPRRPDQRSRLAVLEQYMATADHLPQVVYLDGAVAAGQPIPSSPLCTSAWSATSWSIGDADDAPLTLPFDLTAYNAALHATAAGLASLLSVPADPQAGPVEVAARDVMTFQTGMITANFIPYERPWRREGRRPPGSAGLYPVGLFECLDGHVVLLCRSQAEWDRLLDLMGRPAWSADPRFADPRVVAREHADELDGYLLPWIAGQTVAQLSELGAATGLPVAPVRTIGEALTEPQFAFRRFLEKVNPADDTTAVPVLVAPTVPWRLHEPSDTSTTVPRAWPVLDERTGEPGSLLRGLRVLDFSWVWSGPMTASILGNLGAEVIKVEHSGHLDTGRARGRARRDGAEIAGPEHEVTPYFNQMNYGKRSITVDMKTAEGRALLRRLAAECDIVVENMRPGALERNGLDYATLAADNPALVMVSLSMAGQEGPLRTLKGYAAIMAALSGLESLVGYDESRLVGTLSPSIGDPNAAGHALVALFAALLRRRDTGRGAWIDLSQVEALFSVLAVPALEAQIRGRVEVPGNRHHRHAPHGHFGCAGNDRWLALDVSSDEEWRALLEVAREVDASPAASWESWDADARLRRRSDVEAWLADWVAGQDRDDLVAALLAAGVAAAPVLSYEELLEQAWLHERELTVPVHHRYLGDIDQYVVPWRIDGVAQTRTTPAPLLGADTDAVLTEVLGMTAEQVDTLRQAGVLR